MERDQLSRKLAVILHADVVGSTLLVQQNETLAHERIQAAFNYFSETIKNYGGITRELRGDALVAEFERASDAVPAALAFQVLNEALNSKLDDDIQPQLRIGVSLGEVIIADNTITGAGVVLAQRLEQLADSGGVVVQGSVSETVPARLPFEFESLGEQKLKGFDQPVKAFAVKLRSGEELPGPEANKVTYSANPKTLQVPDKPSIAVLPFDNMSGDPEQEYFSDGITEDIITALSRVSGLLVVARNSTMVYKGKSVDVKLVGREQGVRYALEGSVRKAGNRVRVSCQLIDTVTGLHKYAERFDRELDDIFQVQDEITRQVTVELQVHLTSGEQARLWAGGTANIAAWESALKADDLMARHIREENHQARAKAQNAISLDPEYAAAWSTLGMTHWEDARWGWSESKDASLELAESAARESERIDSNYPGTYSLLGLIFLARGQHKKSIEKMEQAVNLAPNHAASVALYALALHLSMRPDECIRQMKRAMRLSPVYPYWYIVPLAGSHLLRGEPQLAHDALVTAIEREPGSALPRVWLTITLVELGRRDESREQAKQVIDLDPGFSIAAWSRGIAFEDISWNRKLEQSLRDANLPV
jgi:TolB-like protein/class 3 adenylate cyclase/tetratricopeptide (TPR) repeat protein